MCGIAGLWRAPGPRADVEPDLLGMLRQLVHRGPDGQGHWCGDAVALGHTRLALVDPAGGQQPLHSEDGQIHLVCNGEIYNHAELRRELTRAGHRMATGSDCEVILHLYEEHGLAALDRLNGPFAIALWDAHRQHLWLARDRMGMRPLYWCHRPDGSFAFASEAKALLALPGVARAADPAGLQQLFQWWGTLGEQTVFQDIRQVPPGHHLLLRQPDRPQLTRWWDWSFAPDPVLQDQPIEALADELRERLAAAVHLQQQADVPVGLYLSGGLDSTVLGALMSQRGRQTASAGGARSVLHSWGVAFEDPAFDERAQQQAAAAHLGLQHHLVLSAAADRAAALPRCVWHAETPFTRMAPAALLGLAEATRAAGFKAVLSGEGADEILAGYDLFKEARLRRFLARQPHSRWRPALLSRLYPYLEAAPTAPGTLAAARWAAQQLAPDDPLYAHRSRMQAGARIDALWSPEWRETLQASTPGGLDEAFAAALPDGFAQWPDLGRDQLGEVRTLLPGYLLSTQGDRIAMAAGVELRHPYLDHGLVEWLGRLPPRLKLRGLREKHLLRAAARPLLPQALLDRPKQPFRAPDSASLFDAQGQLPAWAQALLAPEALRETGWCDAPRVQALVQKCRTGRARGFADNMALVGLLTLLSWRNQFLSPGAAT